MSQLRRDALLEAVIGVKRPLAPAGGGLGIQPVGWEHHEDEVGVELLLLLFHVPDIIRWFHTCRSEISVRLEGGEATPGPQRGEAWLQSAQRFFLFRGRPRPCSLLCRARVCSTDLPLIAKAVDVLLLVDAVCSTSLSVRSKRLHTMAEHSLRPRRLRPGAQRPHC